MYTNGIYGSSGISYNFANDTQRSGQQENAAQQARQNSARPAMLYTGSNSMAGIAKMVEASLEGVEPDANGKITFEQVRKHKEAMQEEFSEQVKADLKELGVAEDIEFRLVANPTSGGIEVVTDHEDKALIEKYFKANPEMAEKFNKIEMLGNLDRAKQYQGLPPGQMKKDFQMQAMDYFLGNAQNNGMSMASGMMDFSAAGSSFLMGGLNRMV